MIREKQEKLFNFRISKTDYDKIVLLALKLGDIALSDVVRLSMYDLYEKIVVRGEKYEIR